MRRATLMAWRVYICTFALAVIAASLDGCGSPDVPPVEAATVA